MKYNEFDLIITSSSNKINILKQISKDHKLIKTKIITLKEFVSLMFGKVKKETIYYMMKNKKVSVEVAKTLLDNAFFIEDLWTDLNQHNYIEYDKYFNKSFKKVLIYNEYLIDPYIKKILDKYDTKYYFDTNLNFEHNIIEFNYIDNEIEYCATQILDLINNNVSVNNIKLVNVTSDYIIPLKRILGLYNIPVTFEEKNSIYKTKVITNFLNQLDTMDLKENLNSLDHNEIYNILIDILNKFSFAEYDNYCIEILIDEFKNHYLENKKYDKSIECINISDVENSDKYYFILGFNDGSLPKTKKDEDYLSDEIKLKKGLLTSYEQNKINKKMVMDKYHSVKNLFISYKLKNNYETFLPSSLIIDNNLPVIKNVIIKNTYTDLVNKIKFTNLLDNLIKYNESSDLLPDLEATYSIKEYKKYDNSFTGIKKNDFYEYIKNNILLSYSSLDNYFKCEFRYYIQNVLKLIPYEETLPIIIGNLFHLCLSKMYDNDFDLDNEYEKFILTKNFKSDELFFIKKLKSELKFIIDTIKKQDSFSLLTKVETEKKIYIDKSNDIKITFMGVIDKFKYEIFDNQMVAAIIDYKTGNLETCIDNINYGLHMQLPIYIYLEKETHPKVLFAGFYLQRILNQNIIDEEYEEKEKKLKLDGFSNSDSNIISKFDNNYENSSFIKSLKTTNNGWYTYAKVLDNNSLEKISAIANDKIDEAISSIKNASFNINPKRIAGILEGCKYCKFHDLCYCQEENIVDLEYTKIEDILRGEK